LQDNGGYFAGGPCGGSVLVTWPETTQSYYKNTKVRLCPEATKPYDQGGQPPFAAWSDYGDLPIYASYGTNVWNANSEEQKYWRTAYVARARYVPLMFDTNWRELMPEPYDLPPPYDGYWWTPNRDEMQRVCINRHLGAVNMLFLDFSVRKVGLKHLWHLKWHREWPDDSPLPVWPEWMENFKDY
jgi:prepilin-type processing-associated H-X9-DG protein